MYQWIINLFSRKKKPNEIEKEKDEDFEELYTNLVNSVVKSCGIDKSVIESKSEQLEKSLNLMFNNSIKWSKTKKLIENIGDLKKQFGPTKDVGNVDKNIFRVEKIYDIQQKDKKIAEETVLKLTLPEKELKNLRSKINDVMNSNNIAEIIKINEASSKNLEVVAVKKKYHLELLDIIKEYNNKKVCKSLKIIMKYYNLII